MENLGTWSFPELPLAHAPDLRSDRPTPWPHPVQARVRFQAAEEGRRAVDDPIIR